MLLRFVVAADPAETLDEELKAARRAGFKDVEKLDRVMSAGLTKKNVSRGQWRFLNEKELIALKHFRT